MYILLCSHHLLSVRRGRKKEFKTSNTVTLYDNFGAAMESKPLPRERRNLQLYYRALLYSLICSQFSIQYQQR